MKYLKMRLRRFIDGFNEKFIQPVYQRVLTFSIIILGTTIDVLAQSEGQSAIAQASTMISQYQSQVKSLMNAIAAIIAIVGAFNVFYKMNNGDQDVKKTIMLTIGGCIAFVVLGQALPAFFGA